MSIFEDRELVELLADRPQLLALADAIRDTQRRPRRRGRLLPALAAALAAVAALALLVPWPEHGPSGLQRALAAVGDGPVIHAVVEYDSPGDVLIEIASGRQRSRVYRTEYWYDAERQELRTRLFADGVQMTQSVETPSRSDSDLGRSRVEGGGFAPALDPALAGFVTHYREALRSGTAAIVDRSTLAGRELLVLQFGLADGSLELVTVDAASYKPLGFRYVSREAQGPAGLVTVNPASGVLSAVFGSSRSARVAPAPLSPQWRVVKIESLAREPAFFAPPPLSPPRPTAGSGGDWQPATLSEARRALGRSPFWLGRSFDAHALDAVELGSYTAELTNGGGTVQGQMIRLRYGEIVVSEAVDRAAAYQLGFDDGGAPPPPAGYLEQARPGVAELERDGVAIQLEAPSVAKLVAAARALSPAP